ncbi:MAG: hypothetical protein ACXACI_07990 [Candidatus Hodarchaeales archaeon]
MVRALGLQIHNAITTSSDRWRKVPAIRRVIQTILMAYQALWRFLLAHHPLCDPFRADVVTIRNIRFCKGCLTTYPPFLGGIVVGYIFLLFGFAFPSGIASLSFLVWWTFLGLGFFLVKDTFFLRKIKTGIRILAFGISGLIFDGLLSLNRLDLIFLAYLLAIGLSAFVMHFRLKKLNETCAQCPEFSYRGRCSGLKTFSDFTYDVSFPSTAK